MTREFNVVIERDEDGHFVASVPALRGCHTQAKSLVNSSNSILTLTTGPEIGVHYTDPKVKPDFSCPK